mmetsp:Transcript_6140/g.14802  ORF Transcript_6140/g.14802 Transcript_6140/m.14802 type:complete len:174 (-) Transcript_6140:156-677(-)
MPGYQQLTTSMDPSPIISWEFQIVLRAGEKKTFALSFSTSTTPSYSKRRESKVEGEEEEGGGGGEEEQERRRKREKCKEKEIDKTAIGSCVQEVVPVHQYQRKTLSTFPRARASSFFLTQLLAFCVTPVLVCWEHITDAIVETCKVEQSMEDISAWKYWMMYFCTYTHIRCLY